MSGKNTNRYRCCYCYYFLHKGSGKNGSFDFMATNDKRAQKYVKALEREKNKKNEKQIKCVDSEMFMIRSLSRISIELAEKETFIFG